MKKRSNKLVLAVSIGVLACVVIFAFMPDDLFTGKGKKNTQGNDVNKGVVIEDSLADNPIEIPTGSESTTSTIDNGVLTLGSVETAVNNVLSSNESISLLDALDLAIKKQVLVEDYESYPSDITFDTLNNIYKREFKFPEYINGVVSLNNNYKDLAYSMSVLNSDVVYYFSNVTVASFIDSNTVVCEVDDKLKLVVRVLSPMENINIGSAIDIPVLGSLLNYKLQEDGELLICGVYIEGVM